MKKIGITGSLASGKTTASKILSFRQGPLFSADVAVRGLYKKKSFKRYLSRKLKIHDQSNMKNKIKDLILSKKFKIEKLEKLIHPFVRNEMKIFKKKNKNEKFTFFEIPLLVESKLIKEFDIIFYIKAKKSIRLKRFQSKRGDKKLFNILNRNQLMDIKKVKFCDHIIVNEKNLKILKKKLLDIFKRYE
tara:strand:+ start:937 stop:1503 length:567 start_codon:yes stop_codon:yes gene_type:complete